MTEPFIFTPDDKVTVDLQLEEFRKELDQMSVQYDFLEQQLESTQGVVNFLASVIVKLDPGLRSLFEHLGLDPE